MHPILIGLIIHGVLALLAAVDLFRRPIDPMWKLTWLIFIVIVPIAGSIVYLLFGRGRQSGAERPEKQSQFTDRLDDHTSSKSSV